MANNQVNLGKLDYDQIRKSLTDFLKDQETLKDYNFNGSVIQTVVSLLAYNTFYYAFYSNMLANELFIDTAQREESIVSLMKPLGILVPTKTSSRIRVNVGGVSSVSQYDQFYGTNDDGVVYNFYALEEYIQEDPSVDFVEGVVLVEGKELVKNKDISTLINYDTQSYFLGDKQIDVSTIVVEVDTGDGVYKRWNRQDNIGDSTENLSQNIYFIERFDTGFEVQFGKEKSLGNDVLPTYKTRVSYLVSSGAASNGITVFTKAVVGVGQNITIQIPDSASSSGGLDTPDLDYYRFIGPKYFASQNRAVTKEDFLAISTEYLKTKGYNVTKNNFNVYGGDEIYPPKYGRVFIATDAVQTPDILDLVAYLKTKCTLTILPEYVTSNSETVVYDTSIVFLNNNLSQSEKRNLLTSIRNYLIQNYSFISSYNINFSGVEQALLQKFPEIQSSSIKLKFDSTYNTIPEGGLEINLENELDIFDNQEVTITEEFQDLSNNTVVLRAYANTEQERSQIKQLRTYVKDSIGNFVYSQNLNYGSINIVEGYIKINYVTENPVTVKVRFASPTFISSTNTRFSVVPNTVIDL